LWRELEKRRGPRKKRKEGKKKIVLDRTRTTITKGRERGEEKEKKKRKWGPFCTHRRDASPFPPLTSRQIGRGEEKAKKKVKEGGHPPKSVSREKKRGGGPGREREGKSLILRLKKFCSMM